MIIEIGNNLCTAIIAGFIVMAVLAYNIRMAYEKKKSCEVEIANAGKEAAYIPGSENDND